jgi:ribonuclease VapC
VLIAVLFAEPGHLELVDRILAADHVRVGAPTLAETSLVFIGRRSKPGASEVDELVKELGITVVPFGEPEWRVAVDAFARFGRGRHKAALNFGDCLAYASAAAAGDTLLFVGDDFKHTDAVSP